MNARPGLVAFATMLAVALPARAQLPPDGQPIKTNHYGIDLYQGPVLASTRVIGLAGAFVAIGEGTEGDQQNPAAPAVRVPWSNGHFDYDLSFGVTFPTTLKNSDFFNSGRRTDLPKGTTGGFVFLDAATNLQLGKWGFGLTTDLQEYALNGDNGATIPVKDRVVAQISVTHIQLARSFADGQIIVGAGDRIATLAVQHQNGFTSNEQDLFSTVGNGYELGLLLRPNNEQFRIGVAYRSEVNSRASGNTIPEPVTDLYLPERVTVPWDLDLGMAIQLGARPLNPRWVDPALELERIKRFLHWRELERQRYRKFELARVEAAHGDVEAAARALDAELETEAALDDVTLSHAEDDTDQEIRQQFEALERFHLLIVSSLVVSGSAQEAVGVESFLQRVTQRSGTTQSYSPRIGVETETVPNWLRLRAGSYLEPSRFPSNRQGARVHGTLGFDEKLFAWDVFGSFHEGTHWRVGGSLDAARNYFGWSVAIGVWH
ncbi:MAG TPA: hypothetical protein VGM44_03560 [Polyangiaceae bacterium]